MDHPSSEFQNQLHAYHPARGAPPSDDCARAIEAALADPELRQWWEREQACDHVLGRKICEAAGTAPEDLKTRLLKITADAGASGTAPHSQNFWHWTALGGIAAAFMLAALFFTFVFQPPAAQASPELAAVIVQLEGFLAHDRTDLHRDESYDALLAHLTHAGAPAPKEIPAGLSKEDGFACSNLVLDGMPVGMLCFEIDGDLVHVFTIDRASIPGQTDLPTPVVHQFDKHCSATWTADDQIFVLATRASAEKLLALL